MIMVKFMGGDKMEQDIKEVGKLDEMVEDTQPVHSKRKIAVVLLAVVVLSVCATAGVIYYLSNTVNASVEVGAPMLFKISATDCGNPDCYTTDAVVLEPSYGGELVRVYMYTENRASEIVDGIVKISISNDDGVNCSDIIAIDSMGANIFPGELIETCEVISANEINFSYAKNWIPNGLNQGNLFQILIDFTPTVYKTFDISVHADSIEII